MLGNEVPMSQALIVSVGCMALVFILLYILSLILESFKYFFKEKKAEFLKKGNSVEEIAACRNEMEITSLEEEDDIVAAIAATIAASEGNKNSRIHIRSIKRIN